MGACVSSGKGDQAAGGLAQSYDQHAVDATEAVAALAGDMGFFSPIELSISASQLADLDVWSKSDPMAVIFSRTENGQWTEVDRTEVVSNTLAPDFSKQVRVMYSFQDIQEIKIQIYDVDTKFDYRRPRELPLELQDYLGEIDFVLSELLTEGGQAVSKPMEDAINNRRCQGMITVRAEEVANSNALITLALRAGLSDKKDRFGGNDPFFKIWRLREDGSKAAVYKSEVKYKNMNPTWNQLRITMAQLCNGDMERPLSIEVLDWDRNSKDDMIGEASTSLTELLAKAGTSDGIPIVNQALKASRPDYSASGMLYVDVCSVGPRHSFLDYVVGGCELSFMVAVDFTASNGDPRDSRSLHFIDPSGSPNVYQKAVRAVGNVVEFYDADKRFPAWGFGGRQAPNPVSHSFALNGDANNCEVLGVDGILQAYRQALRVTTLSGPTLFGPVIQAASTIASEFVDQDNQKYFILLILTDGAVTDMDQTLDAIINASSLPISIIIVGVGCADFSKMDVLDGDTRRLTVGNKRAVRDIVQFVAFNKYSHLKETEPSVALAHDVLAELPGQVLEYMALRNISPNPPRDISAPPPEPPPPSMPPPPMDATMNGDIVSAPPAYGMPQPSESYLPPPPPMNNGGYANGSSSFPPPPHGAVPVAQAPAPSSQAPSYSNGAAPSGPPPAGVDTMADVDPGGMFYNSKQEAPLVAG